MQRSKEVLGRARDVIMGRKEGTSGEKGWAKAAFVEQRRVCLNAALRVAERDVVLKQTIDIDMEEGQWHSRSFQTDEGRDAHRFLARAIIQKRGYDENDYDLNSEEMRQQLIIHFNDHETCTQQDIDEVLELAEKIAWEDWVYDLDKRDVQRFGSSAVNLLPKG